MSKLSPKKWGLSGSSSVVLVAFLGGLSFLVNQGIDVRPNLAALLGLAVMDSIFLGGSCLAQISSYWPPYRRRIIVHEAGHLLTGKALSRGQIPSLEVLNIEHHPLLLKLFYVLHNCTNVSKLPAFVSAFARPLFPPTSVSNFFCLLKSFFPFFNTRNSDKKVRY